MGRGSPGGEEERSEDAEEEDEQRKNLLIECRIGAQDLPNMPIAEVKKTQFAQEISDLKYVYEGGKWAKTIHQNSLNPGIATD